MRDEDLASLTPIAIVGVSEASAFWKIIAISWPRTRRSSSDVIDCSEVPRYRTSPSTTVGNDSRPSIACATVVLPAADSPTSASTSPPCRSKETSRTAGSRLPLDVR